MYPIGGGKQGPLSDPKYGKGKREKGPASSAGPLRKVAVLLLLVALVVALLVATAFLTSKSPTLRALAMGAIGVVLVSATWRWARRRTRRRSIDETLPKLKR